MKIYFRQATVTDSHSIALLVNELLSEIITATGVQHFHLDLVGTKKRVEEWLLQGTYVAFVALTQDSEDFLGFVGLFESYALYAEGQFGTIPEFYVRPEFRSQGNGRMLLDCAVAYGQGKGWICLAVTTPPLPAFEKSLSFYERQGFSITGGRKLRRPI